MAKKDKKDELPNTFSMLGGSGTQNTPSSSNALFGALTQKTFGDSSATPQTGAGQKDVFATGTGGKTIKYNRTWEEILADTQHWARFPFSHGMELELVICDDQGKYIEGEKVVHVLKELTNEAKKILTQIINGERKDFPKIPDCIKAKVKTQPYIKEYPDKGTNLGFDYQIQNDVLTSVVRTDAFGRDGNVTMATIILELVTPPCQYAEELAFWAGTLFNLAKVCLPKSMYIMSTAINPTMKEYINGLSHGDHHHCGSFATHMEKMQAFDMARAFIPHIVALSCTSPFINNGPTDVIKTMMVDNKPRITSPNCIRSIRLKNNTTMLSNMNEPNKYIPYLFGRNQQEDEQLFLKTTQYASLYDSRFQDVFPFTRYGTIELRICDAQISICRRIGLAMLLESMYYKAKKLNSQSKWSPNVTSECICINRRAAVERGLFGLFKTPNVDRAFLNQFDPAFADCYMGPTSNPYRFLFESVQGMFRYLKDTMVELGYLYSPFMKPLLQSVFGDITYAAVPMNEADYQLCLYDFKQKQGKRPNVFEDLTYFTIEYSKDPIQQPLTGDLTLPDYMK